MSPRIYGVKLSCGATALDAGGQEEAAKLETASALHLSQTFEGEWKLDGTCDPEAGAVLEPKPAAVVG